jgi:outer membrane protein assembly factor BamD (BamD/ComL family)
LAENDPRLDPETYLQRVPKDPAMIDSLIQERNFANYQLGLIYREKFRENALAAEKLEFVLENDPEERLIIPAKYNLYKTYMELGEVAKAQSLKNDIIYQYPDSRYAAILQDPQSLLQDENNPTVMYEEVFQLYEEQKFSEVIEQTNTLSSEFSGDEIVPKLELLKAMAQGRLHGLESYREGLNYVALNYPQSVEGRKAQELLETALPTLSTSVFQNDSLATSFKLVFPFEAANEEKAEELEKVLSTSIEKLNYSHLKVSKDVYDSQQVFIVVHGFSSAERALGYAELLANNKEFRLTRKSFYISAANYRIAQIHKNIDTYLQTINPPNDVYTGKEGNNRAEQRTEQDSPGNKDNR